MLPRNAAEEDAHASGSVATVEAAVDAGVGAPAATAKPRDERGRFLPVEAATATVSTLAPAGGIAPHRPAMSHSKTPQEP